MVGGLRTRFCCDRRTGIRHQADDGSAGARSIGQCEPYRTAGRHDGRVPIRPEPRPVKALHAGPIAERHRCGRTGSERVARHSGRTVRRRRHCRNGCHNCRRCSWNRGDAPFGATADADSDNPRAIWRQDDYATAAIDSSSSPTLSDGTATEAFPATTNAGAISRRMTKQHNS